MSEIVYESELYHHGILGQKWGIRRYQNTDGSLTSKGKIHAKQMDNTKTVSNKSGNNAKKDLTPEEKVARSEHRKEVAKTVAKGALKTAAILAAGIISPYAAGAISSTIRQYEAKQEREFRAAFDAEMQMQKMMHMPTIKTEPNGNLFVVPAGKPRSQGYTVLASDAGYYKRQYPEQFK